MSKSIFILSVLFCVLTVGCSSPKVASVKYSALFDFSTVKNYSFYQRNSDFSDWQSLSDTRRNSIELAIEKAMAEYGFSYVPTNKADVIFTYYWADHGGAEFKRYNEGVVYCSYCLTHSHTGDRSDKLMMNAGSLIIDAIDPRSKRSVWRTSYPLKIKDKDNSHEMHEKVIQAVNVMLKNFHRPNVQQEKNS